MELAVTRAEDVLAYHDTNEDNSISLVELKESTLQWNVLYKRFLGLKKLDPSKKKSAEKARRIELDCLKEHGGCGNFSGDSSSNAACSHAVQTLQRRKLVRLSSLAAWAKGEEDEEDFEDINGHSDEHLRQS